MQNKEQTNPKKRKEKEGRKERKKEMNEMKKRIQFVDGVLRGTCVSSVVAPSRP